MKLIKTFETIKSVLAGLFLVTLVIEYTPLFPEFNRDIVRLLGSIIVFLYLLLSISSYKRLENLYYYKETSLKIQSNKVDVLDKTLINRNKEVNELNDMIVEIRQEKREIEQKYNLYKDRFNNLLTVIFFGNNTKVCAVVDGVAYYSFEVKKEAGLIVSRKRDGKNEKVEAELGFNCNGILFTKDMFKENYDKPENEVTVAL